MNGILVLPIQGAPVVSAMPLRRGASGPPASPPSPPSGDAPGPDETALRWLARCWVEGVTASFVAQAEALGPRVAAGDRDDDNTALRAFTAMAAMGRGDYDLADALLTDAPPGEGLSSPVSLLDATARLYRACGEAERDPERAQRAMKELHAAELALPRGAEHDTTETATARGYAGLSHGEALLMVGDVGAARHQLERVVGEERSERGLRPPAVLLTTVRCILGGIEQAVGRGDLAVAHLQAAVRDAAGFAQEEQVARLLLCGSMLADNHRFGEALLRDLKAQGQLQPEALEGHGTIAHLHRLLVLLAGESPFPLPVRAEMRELLRFLQGRHYSAGWFLLVTSLTAGALLGAGDAVEAYNILVHAAAALRCRRMEGAADLCDRQLTALRQRLGEEHFEAVVTEARERRRAFLNYLQQVR